MKYPIDIELVKESKLEGIDLTNLAFGKTFTDHMFVAEYKYGEWTSVKVQPYGPIAMEPSIMALHYGQAVFEGMKANISTQTGEPILFRPEMHLERINRSNVRMGMPEIPAEIFYNAVHSIVALDKEWIPQYEGAALYLRPFMFASEPSLGVRASAEYKFILFASPVGPYYPKPVNILVAEKYVRAFPGGVGFAKAAGNYAATIQPAKIAKEAGFDQILWLDGIERKYLQECGTMNVFAVIGNKVVTPPTGDTILAGITRNTLLQLLEQKGIEVEVRDITIAEILEAHANGELKEMFGSGTAAVISHIASFSYKDTSYDLPAIEDRKVGPMLKELLTSIKEGRVNPENLDWIVPAKLPFELVK